MAVFRILEATARPGAADELARLLVRQERDVVAYASGVVFAQSLRSGDRVLAVSSWRSQEELQRYLDRPETGAFYRALPDLLMGIPSIRTFEVIGDIDAVGSDRAPGGWGTA